MTVNPDIRQSVIDESSTAVVVAPIRQSAIDEFSQHSAARFWGLGERLGQIAHNFPLPWTHYVRLLRVKNPLACEFYTREALAGGWSVRQLHRQISSQFYERTALSKDKAAMLLKGETPEPADAVRTNLVRGQFESVDGSQLATGCGLSATVAVACSWTNDTVA